LHACYRSLIISIPLDNTSTGLVKGKGIKLIYDALQPSNGCNRSV